MRTAIETHPTGTYFDFADPQPEMIHVEDIARALSHTARFGGHTSRFYSVAEHALLVARLVRDVAGPELQFAALHHDSHEAYLGDIPTPLKVMLRNSPMFDVLVNAVDAAIETRFDILTEPSLFRHDIIKAADAQALAIEASVLKVSRGVGEHWPSSHTAPAEVPTGAVACSDPQWVEHLFLATHYLLQGDVAAARLGLVSYWGRV